MLAVLAVCAAPVIASYFTYYVVRPEGRRNYGELVEPQRAIPAQASARTLGGAPRALESLRGQWLLVSADASACPESCVRKLFILRNSHASQGKNVNRLERIWFVLDDGKVPQQVLDAYVGTHMLRADPEKLAAFLAPDATPEQREAALKAPMWIIDPLGNLMMGFPDNADPESVRGDIRKLIHNSRIG
jgi:hypothetical protein